MKKTVYGLYASNGKNFKIEMKIERNPITSEEAIKAASEKVQEYNQYWYICTNLKNLKEKAELIKEKWIEELEKEIEEIKNIKIPKKQGQRNKTL